MQVSKCLLACLAISAASITLGAFSALPSYFLESAEPLTGISFFIGPAVPLENQGNWITDEIYQISVEDEDRITGRVVGMNVKLRVYSDGELGLCGYLSRYSVATKLNWNQVLLRKGENILSLSPGFVSTSGGLDLNYYPVKLWYIHTLNSQAWGAELPVIWTHKFPVSAKHPYPKITFNACAKSTYAHNKMYLRGRYGGWGAIETTRDLGTADVFTGSVGANFQFRGKYWMLTPEVVIRLIPIDDNVKVKPGIGVSWGWLSDWSVFKK